MQVSKPQLKTFVEKQLLSLTSEELMSLIMIRKWLPIELTELNTVMETTWIECRHLEGLETVMEKHLLSLSRRLRWRSVFPTSAQRS